jgi:hypothetical protein
MQKKDKAISKWLIQKYFQIKPKDFATRFLKSKYHCVRSEALCKKQRAVSEKQFQLHLFICFFLSFPPKKHVHYSRFFVSYHLSSLLPLPEHIEPESSSHRKEKGMTLSGISSKGHTQRRDYQFIKTWTRKESKAPI